MNRALGYIHGPDHTAAIKYKAAFQPVTVPDSCDWHSAMQLVPIDPLGNDDHGDCVEAATYRLAQLRMANAWKSTWVPTKALVLGAYAAWTGFNPATGDNDNGTDPATAQAAGQAGLDLGLQDKDYVLPITVDMQMQAEVRRAIWDLGGVVICLSLPTAWQGTKTWDVGPNRAGDWAAGSWGGHATASGWYDKDGVFRLITWGEDDYLLTPKALGWPCTGWPCGAVQAGIG